MLVQFAFYLDVKILLIIIMMLKLKLKVKEKINSVLIVWSVHNKNKLNRV